MRTSFLTRLSLAFTLTFSASASIAAWEVSEVFSNASGDVQFIEIYNPVAGGEAFSTFDIWTYDPVTNTESPGVLLGPDLPGSSEDKFVLIGTALLAADAGVQPDFIIPDGFLPLQAGQILSGSPGLEFFLFFDYFAPLPADGMTSLHADGLGGGLPGAATPTNYAGQTGSPGGPVDVAVVNLGLDPALQTCAENTGATMASEITSLDCSYSDVDSLGGIEQLFNLTDLNVQGNNLTDASPIEVLTSLTVLDINGNQIGVVPILPGGIEQLNIGNNPINDISQIYNFPGLTWLNVDYLPAELDLSQLSGFTSLTALEFRGYGYDDLSSIGGLTNLTLLAADDNAVSDLSPIAGLVNLTEFYFANNVISDISVLVNFTNLQYVSLRFNRLEDISDFSAIPSLVYLDLGGNQISDLSPLEDLNLQGDIYLYDNRISDLSPIAGQTGITGLFLDNNGPLDLNQISGMVQLQQLTLNDGSIIDLTPIAGLTSLERLSLETNGISDISALFGMTNLTELYLQGNLINSDDAQLGDLSHYPDSIDPPGRPAINFFSLDPTYTNLDFGSADIVWDMDIDTGAGYYISLNFNNAGTGSSFSPGGDKYPLTINELAPRGFWEVRLDTDDGWHYNAVMFEALGYSSGVFVDGTGPGDGEEPELYGFGFGPDLIDADLGPQLVEFNLDVGDPSGISYIEVQLEGPNGEYRSFAGSVVNNTLRTVFSAADAPGEWVISGVQAQDNAGNGFFLGTQQVQDLGLPWMITITSDQGPFTTALGTLGLPPALQDCVNDTGVQFVHELTYLDCTDWGINDLTGIGQLAYIDSLHINDNPITDISMLAGLPLLVELGANDTLISDISSLTGVAPHMRGLHLSNAPVDDISLVYSMTGLNQLNVGEIKDFDLTQLFDHNRLDGLWAHGTGTSDISVLSDMFNLEVLNLDNNRVSDLGPLYGLNLREAYLSRNLIFNPDPLETSTDLEVLTLGNNELFYLPPVYAMPNLRELSIENNQLTDLSGIENAANLQSVNLRNNGLSSLESLELLPLLQWVDITGNWLIPGDEQGLVNAGVGIQWDDPTPDPEILNVYINPGYVNLDDGDTEVSFYVDLHGSQDSPPVDYYCIRLSSPAQVGGVTGCDNPGNVIEHTFTLTDASARGPWYLSIDGQYVDGSYFYMSSATIGQLGWPVGLAVDGEGSGDFMPPVLNFFEFSPDVLDVSLGEAYLDVYADFTDDQGISYMEVTACNYEGSCASADLNTEFQNGELWINLDMGLGGWYIDHVYAEDFGNNGRWVGRDELEQMGFPTTFDVAAPGLADDDGDGFNNAQENAQGTNPDDINHHPGSAGLASLDSALFVESESSLSVLIPIHRMLSDQGELTVDYETFDGLALNGTDYEYTTGSIAWQSGDKDTQFIEVPLYDRQDIVGSRSFNLRLTGVSGGGQIGVHDASVVITQDEYIDDGTPYGGAVIVNKFNTHVEETTGSVFIRLSRILSGNGEVTAYFEALEVPREGWEASATGDLDFISQFGSVTWQDGEMGDRVIEIPIIDDADWEQTEAFTFRVTSAEGEFGNALAGGPATTIYIVDDDRQSDAGVFSFFETRGPFQEEETGLTTVRVTRTYGGMGNAYANISTGQSSATLDVDFESLPWQDLFWADGDMTAREFQIPLYDDNEDEEGEVIVVLLQNLWGDYGPEYEKSYIGLELGLPFVLDYQDSRENIIDSDGDGILDVADADDDGDGFNDLNDAFPRDASEWGDADGDGQGDNSDHDDDNDQLSDDEEWAFGLDPYNADDAHDDNDFDGFDNFNEVVNGSDPNDGNSIPPGGDLEFSALYYTGVEEDGYVDVMVRRVRSAGGDVSAELSLHNIQAEEGIDYFMPPTPLFWGSGDMSPRSVRINLFDDVDLDSGEYFRVALNNVQGARVAMPSTLVSILDNDGPGQQNYVSVMDLGLKTSESENYVNVRVRRFGDGVGDAEVSYGLRPDPAPDANVAEIYTDIEYDVWGTLYWGDGDMGERIVTIPLLNDDEQEPTESISFRLFNPANTTLLANGTSLSIRDDDYRSVHGRIQVGDSGGGGHEIEGVTTLHLYREGGTQGEVSVDLGSFDWWSGRILDGLDYSGAGAQLIWGDGDNSVRSISFGLLDNGVADQGGFFFAEVANPQGGVEIDRQYVYQFKLKDDYGLDIDQDQDGYPAAYDIDIDGDGFSNFEVYYGLDPYFYDDGTDYDGDGHLALDEWMYFGTDPAYQLDFPTGEIFGDSDFDGVNDYTDRDDDNDGLLDWQEIFNGLNPYYDVDADEDWDGDGFSNRDEILQDTNPHDFNSSPLTKDTDGDGVPDVADAFPFDEFEQSDFDGDGLGDNADFDDDNDRIDDGQDIAPYDPEIGFYIEMASTDVRPAYLIAEDSVLDDPDFLIGTYGDSANTVYLDQGGSGVSTDRFGNTPVLWEITPDGVFRATDPSDDFDLDDTWFWSVWYMADLGLISYEQADAFEQATGETDVEVTDREIYTDLFLIEQGPDGDLFWEQGLDEILVVDVTDRGLLLGDELAEPLPMEYVDGLVFFRDLDAMTSIPFEEQLVADSRMMLQLEFSEDDWVVDEGMFNANLTGITLISGRTFTWIVSGRGTLVVTMDDTSDVIEFEQMAQFDHGMGVLATLSTVADDYAWYEFGMTSSIVVEPLQGQFLMQSVVLQDTDYRNEYGAVTSEHYFGFELYDDGTAQRTVGYFDNQSGPQLLLQPYTWEQVGNQLVLEGKRSTNRGWVELCDVGIDGCYVFSERTWDIQASVDGRLYVIERLARRTFGEPDSNLELLAGPRVRFYESYEWDLDADGIPDYYDPDPDSPEPGPDSDFDGTPDVTDYDDDNDGAPDVLDIAPLDDRVGFALEFNDNNRSDEYVSISLGALDNPSFATNVSSGETYELEPNGEGKAISENGSFPLNWWFVDGALEIEYLPEADDESSSYPVVSDLVELGLADPQLVDSYIANNGDHQVEVRSRDVGATWYLLEDFGEAQEFWVEAYSEFWIANELDRLEFQGSGDIVTALDVNSARRTHFKMINLLSNATDISGLTPWDLDLVALPVLLEESAEPGRRLNADVVRFHENQMAEMMMSGHLLTWEIVDGTLILNDADGEGGPNLITITQTESYGDSFAVYVHVGTEPGEEYTTFGFAVPDAFTDAIDPTAYLDEIVDQFLISAFTLTDQQARDEFGDIWLSAVFGYQLNSDGTATRVFDADPATAYTDLWHWEVDVDGTVTLSARLDADGENGWTFYSGCELENPDCFVFRERSWKPLLTEGDRIYFKEWEQRAGNLDPLDPQYYTNIAPRVNFYEFYTQDLDDDTLSDVDEILGGSDPYTPEQDSDGDGVPDVVDDDDDGDFIPDVDDYAPLDPELGSYLPLTPGDVPAAMVNIIQGALADPDFRLGTLAGTTFNFMEGGLASINRPMTGTDDASWHTDNGYIEISYEPGQAPINRFTIQVSAIERVDQQLKDNYIAQYGDHPVVIETYVREIDLFLLGQHDEYLEFHERRFVDSVILDDFVRQELGIDGPPEIFESQNPRTLVDLAALPNLGFSPADVVGEWGLPIDIDPGRLVDETNSFVQSVRSDVTYFDSDGFGALERTGMGLQWGLDPDGRLQIALDNSAFVTVTRVADFADSIGIYTTIELGGETYTRYSIAVKRDGSLDNLDQLVGLHLMKDYILTNVRRYDDSGLLSPLPLESDGVSQFGFTLFDDGSAERKLLFWNGGTPQQPFEIDQVARWTVEGENIILNRLAYPGCPDEEPGCLRAERIWQVLKVTDNRVYMIESGGLGDGDVPPNFTPFLVVTVNFYEAFDVSDVDYDGIPNQWERDNGLNFVDPGDADLDFDGDTFTNIEEWAFDSDPNDPWSVPADFDMDGIPDFVDPDDDNDQVPDEFDAAPYNAEVGAYFPVDPASLDTYIDIGRTGSYLEPDFRTGFEKGNTHRFNPDGTGSFSSAEGTVDTFWSVDPTSGRLDVDYVDAIPGPSYPNISWLAEQGIIDQASADAYIANYGDWQILVNQQVISASFFLLDDGTSEDWYWRTSATTVHIVDDFEREQLLGSIEAGPVYLDNGGGGYGRYLDPIFADTTPFEIDPTEVLALYLGSEDGDFTRFVELRGDGGGTIHPEGVEIFWQVLASGQLEVFNPVNGENTQFTIFREYTEGLAVYSESVKSSGELVTYYGYGFYDEGREDTSAFSDVFLLSSFTSTNPDNRDESGNLYLETLFGFQLNSDGTAWRVLDGNPGMYGPAWAEAYYWHIDPLTGEYLLESWYDKFTGERNVHCDRSSPDCEVWRVRHWQPVEVAADRLYVYEWEEVDLVRDPSTPAELLPSTAIAPRIHFYEIYSQDLDQDGATDIEEAFALSDPFSFDGDNDQDGIIDAIDDDDDNDGIPDDIENFYGLDPYTDNCGTDSDFDSFDDCTEYFGGSDPTDQFSLPDLNPPVISAGANPVIEILSGTEGGVPASHPAIDAYLSGVTAFDDVDGPVMVYNDAPLFFPVGRTAVNFVAQDAVGNADFYTGVVFVEDNREQQLVYSFDRTFAAPGSHLSLPVFYDTTDSNPMLSGLGLRVHFNSEQLSWTGFSNLLGAGLVAQDSEPQPDIDDLDFDPSTDLFVNVAWAAVTPTWPGNVPVELYTVEFDVSEGLLLGDETMVNFSSNNTSAGYGFTGYPTTVVGGLTLDIDGDGEARALTDGLLVLRHLFGFRGDTLTDRAISPEATRNNDEIGEYLDLATQTILDVDGNGEAKALSDGLLILRRLFGFTGDTLITGAVEQATCTVCSPDDVAARIDSLLP